MTLRIVEFPGEDPQLVEGLCLHPEDPPRMLRVMEPYMERRRAWLLRMADRGLRVAVAVGDDGEKRGLVEYVPIEWAAEPVRGHGSLFVNCLWVLPRYWKTGVGGALLEHVIALARHASPRAPSTTAPTGLPVPPSNTAGVTLLGYERDRWFGYFPFMPAAFFKRWGFSEVDRDGTRVLLHLGVGGDWGGRRPYPDAQAPSRAPSLMRAPTRNVETGARHLVEVLFSSQCPWSGWMIDGVVRTLRHPEVEVRLVNTDERGVVEEYGLTRGVCLDGRPLIKRLASGREVARAVARHLRVGR